MINLMYKLNLTDECSIRIMTAQGWLEANFDAVSANLTIERYEVLSSQRHQGHGKQLLRLALVEARLLEAGTISGDITSRESLQAARTVFGEQSLKIKASGQFEQDKRPYHLRFGTEATLLFQLPETA